ncbi:MAG: cation:proton antiporter [Cyclobacteriaceae bacterium]|nr:cation:proton antiporter [Cyclobacteriaceae bacterium]
MIDDIQLAFDGLSPLVRFALAFGLVLLAPRIFERFRLPGVLALIAIGVAFGPRGLHLFRENGEVLMIFAILGKLLLLFFSGLDIEIDDLKKNIRKSLLLAGFSFSLPLIGGIVLGFAFDYGFLSSLMIGILFSSHSVIAYPIMINAGVAKREAVAVTVGATAITDIASLIMFAICLPIHTTGFVWSAFFIQLIFIVAFIPGVIISFRWLGNNVFKRLGDDPAQQLIFLLLVVILAAQGAELVNMDSIVGAFLAGLAVSSTLPNKGIRGQLETLGNTLFIPAFFISLGVLIDPNTVLQTVREHLGLVVGVSGTLVVTKILAAQGAGAWLKYDGISKKLIGSLTIPQVSSTLAVALVAYESMNAAGERLIDSALLNSILVLMVVTSLLGTILAQRFATKMAAAEL